MRDKSIPKCWKCRVEMKKVKETLPEEGIEFDSYECPKCGERITTMKQLHDLAEKYRELRERSFIITFSTWGKSIGFRVPKKAIIQYGIEPGEKGLLVLEKKGFKVIPE